MRRSILLASALTSLLIPAAATTSQQVRESVVTTGASMHSDAALALKQDMRTRWMNRVVSTRDDIIAAVAEQSSPALPRRAR
jgi:hypothetical protein